MLKHCGFSGDDLLQMIIYYCITCRPEYIINLLKTKKEDPFDFEGIENGVMELSEYDTPKNLLLNYTMNQSEHC